MVSQSDLDPMTMPTSGGMRGVLLQRGWRCCTEERRQHVGRVMHATGASTYNRKSWLRTFEFMSRVPDTPDARHQAQMPGMTFHTNLTRYASA
jgi:hypothetical protein